MSLRNLWLGKNVVLIDAGEGWGSEIPLGKYGSFGRAKSHPPSSRRMAIRPSVGPRKLRIRRNTMKIITHDNSYVPQSLIYQKAQCSQLDILYPQMNHPVLLCHFFAGCAYAALTTQPLESTQIHRGPRQWLYSVHHALARRCQHWMVLWPQM